MFEKFNKLLLWTKNSSDLIEINFKPNLRRSFEKFSMLGKFSKINSKFCCCEKFGKNRKHFCGRFGKFEQIFTNFVEFPKFYLLFRSAKIYEESNENNYDGRNGNLPKFFDFDWNLLRKFANFGSGMFSKWIAGNFYKIPSISANFKFLQNSLRLQFGGLAFLHKMRKMGFFPYKMRKMGFFLQKMRKMGFFSQKMTKMGFIEKNREINRDFLNKIEKLNIFYRQKNV